jgi:DUF917 family protein
MFCRRSPKLVALVDFDWRAKITSCDVQQSKSQIRVHALRCPSTWRSFSMNATLDPKTRRVVHRTQIKSDERTG